MKRFPTLLLLLAAAPLARADSKPFAVAPYVAPAAPKRAAPADPSASCGKVSVPDGRSVASGSGTVVACEGGRSLVLTNRHVCPRLGAGKSFEVGGRRYPAFCCCVDSRADLALLIVDADLPACSLAKAAPDAGTPTVQFGHPYAGPQRPKRGIIRGFVGWLRDGLPILHSGINTEQGDSGSGVFADGELVGVTWGEGGSCVHLADVYQLLDTFCVNAKAFPDLAKRVRGVKIAAPAVPKRMPAASPCPGGVCPVPPPAFRAGS